jgi:hypothetical protein
MSASSLGDINPYMGKGELLTGDQSMDWINKFRNTRLINRVSVPPGEDGTVLHADSTTNTGLRWAFPREPLATSLGDSVNLIVEFLKPFVEERIRKEYERLESITPKIYIKAIFGELIYTVPFTSIDTVQNVIDYLNKTFLVSLIHGDFTLIYNKLILEPGRTLADFNIQNEDVLYITTVPVQSAGKYKTRKNHKNRISKGHKRRRTLHK